MPLLTTEPPVAGLLVVVFSGVGFFELGGRTLPREVCSGDRVVFGFGVVVGVGVTAATVGDGVSALGATSVDCGTSIRPTVDADFSSVSLRAPKAPLTSNASTTTAVATGPNSEAAAGCLVCLPATISGSFRRG
ncbi:hypothetical protein Ais01nite_33100 [Asanoa ishikariensis]|nr:hypothetical protein Ais01nite_33100 [Asanoa ishikariensis]